MLSHEKMNIFVNKKGPNMHTWGTPCCIFKKAEDGSSTTRWSSTLFKPFIAQEDNPVFGISCGDSSVRKPEWEIGSGRGFQQEQAERRATVKQRSADHMVNKGKELIVAFRKKEANTHTLQQTPDSDAPQFLFNLKLLH